MQKGRPWRTQRPKLMPCTVNSRGLTQKALCSGGQVQISFGGWGGRCFQPKGLSAMNVPEECLGSGSILLVPAGTPSPGGRGVQLPQLLNQAFSLASSVLQTWLREDCLMGRALSLLNSACLVEGGCRSPVTSPTYCFCSLPASALSEEFLSVIKTWGRGKLFSFK